MTALATSAWWAAAARNARKRRSPLVPPRCSVRLRAQEEPSQRFRVSGCDSSLLLEGMQLEVEGPAVLADRTHDMLRRPVGNPGLDVQGHRDLGPHETG